MKTKYHNLLLVGGLFSATLLTGAFFIDANAQSIDDRVLSRVRVNETKNCAVATIYFNFPVQVTSVFPEESGDHVQIGLRAIELGRIDIGAFRSLEELRPPNSRVSDIQEIQYQGDVATGPVLSIAFKRDKYFMAEPGSDFRSLNIRIADRPIDEACFGKPAKTTKNNSVNGLRGGQIDSDLFSTPAAIDTNAVYALNLNSSQKVINKNNLVNVPTLTKFAAYVTRYEKDGVTWNRMRLGFFKTKTDAQKSLDELKQYYPDAWIVRTTQNERETVYQMWLKERNRNDGKKQTASQASSPKDLPENSEVAGQIAEAQKLMSEGNYTRAIQILTKATTQDENQSTPKAREFLGLAREKNGQLAHAKAEYEDYLRRYPNGEGAKRIRQRLSALLTVGKKAPSELRETSENNSKYVKRINASFSQFYQRDESIVTLERPDLIPDPNKEINRNALISGADITASISNDRLDASLRVSGSHTHDFEKGGRGDFGTLSSLYLDIADVETRLSARLGRQSRSSGGVLGRFDGGLFSFDATENISVNIVGGAPVLRSRDLFIDKDRRFLGASVDVSDIFGHVDTTIYFIHQKVNDLVDRQAAGFELRYVDKFRTAYTLVDYDVFYGSLNLALFNGSWRLKDNTTFNLSLDHRNAPSLSTINAIQGQGVENISMLRSLYTDDELYTFAQARTAKATTGALTVSHPFSEKYQVNAGVTLSNIGATIDAGGVLGQPGTGTDAFYSLQFLGSSIFKQGDLATLGFRIDDVSTSRRYVIDLNTRYPFSKKFRVSPRIRLSQRDSLTADQTQFTVKPSLRLNYIPSRLFQFELDAGGEWTTTKNPLGSETLKGFNINIGYRLDF